ncbi:MAG: T9SS type A sorting domain-containing protein, partial [Fimbriimonadaceae bacterium]|nr:T9SS type A sorting domain-containing protein [Chitinophagales bacterium]
MKPVAVVVGILLCIHVVAQPIAFPDTIGVCNNDSVHIQVLSNDEGTGLLLDDILVEGEYGNANEEDETFIRYKPDEDFTGIDVLIYSVEDDDELFDIASVTIYVMDSLSCVWPGDANDDNIANNIDILNIGLYYGNEGPERFETDPEWDGDYSDDWNDEITLELLSSPKHADCNGDGFVNANDTLPILLNYGEAHLKGTDISGGADDPPLFIDFFTDTIYAGSSVVLPLILGTIDIPATNVYGLAFTISGGDGIIVPGSLRVTFNSGWMGEYGAELISLNYYDSTSADYDVGVSRINHISSTGYGAIGAVEFVMEDDLAGKSNDLSVQLDLCINTVTSVNDFGQILNVQALCDSVIVYQTSTAITPSENNFCKIYPNPATEYCTIYIPQNITGNISVKNLAGLEIHAFEIHNKNLININTNNYPSGTYILEIQNGTMV